MTSRLREELHELRESLPAPQHTDQLAGRAWRAGRRRARRKALAAAAAVVAVLAVGAGLASVSDWAPEVSPANGHGGPGVDRYPEHVDNLWWVRDLPAAPGPIAGVLQSRRSDDSWLAVSPTGRLWKLRMQRDGGDSYPTVSPNGRYLAYLSKVRGPFVVRDLVAGTHDNYPRIGSALGLGTSPYIYGAQTPSSWSPDSQHVVLRTFLRSERRPKETGYLLLTIGGAATPLAVSWSYGDPIGWTSTNEIVWTNTRTTSTRATLRVTDMDGRVLRTLRLKLPGRADLTDQWSWAVSPDGKQLAYVSPDEPATLVRFSLATGNRLGSAATFADYFEPCSLAWAHGTPVVPTLRGDDQPTEFVVPTRPRATIASLDTHLGSCVLWAQDAINGSKVGGVPLTTHGWLWWQQRGSAGVLLLLILAIPGWWLLRRRSRAKD